jgi:hypothetical protein
MGLLSPKEAPFLFNSPSFRASLTPAATPSPSLSSLSSTDPRATSARQKQTGSSLHSAVSWSRVKTWVSPARRSNRPSAPPPRPAARPVLLLRTRSTTSPTTVARTLWEIMTYPFQAATAGAWRAPGLVRWKHSSTTSRRTDPHSRGNLSARFLLIPSAVPSSQAPPQRRASPPR